MGELQSSLNLQLMLFLLVGVGVVVRRLGFVTPESRKSLTDLLINLILPCNIISSFEIELSNELLQSCLIVLIIALGIQILSLGLSHILYRKVPHDQQMVLRYGTICSNAGFMGNPVAEGIYGSTGLLYASIYLIPLRVFMWSAGLSLFTTTSRKQLIRNLLTHPCIVAVVIGFGIMFCPYELPTFLSDTINSIGSCNTAVSMLTIGTILAEVDIKTVFRPLTFYYSFVRLIGIPLIVWVVLKLLGVDPILTGVSVLLAGMPAGSTTAILAAQYNGDAEYASKCVFVSTLLSMVTIPLLSLIV